MQARRVFTGSFETEQMIRDFLAVVDSLDAPVPRKYFKDDYMFGVMTSGRNGPGDAYPRSVALDDTGGFFTERGNHVYLTGKAKGCITA